MEAIVLVGVQGAGKSAWYHANCRDTHLRLNLDMLRTRNRENILLHACLAAVQPFVVDNTNPTAKGRRRYVELAKAAGFRVNAVVFRISLDEALSRNAQRTGRARVPDVAIRGTCAKLEPVTWAEGFDEITWVDVEADD